VGGDNRHGACDYPSSASARHLLPRERRSYQHSSLRQWRGAGRRGNAHSPSQPHASNHTTAVIPANPGHLSRGLSRDPGPRVTPSHPATSPKYRVPGNRPVRSTAIVQGLYRKPISPAASRRAPTPWPGLDPAIQDHESRLLPQPPPPNIASPEIALCAAQRLSGVFTASQLSQPPHDAHPLHGRA
jgi:hypothetical protein